MNHIEFEELLSQRKMDDDDDLWETVDWGDEAEDIIEHPPDETVDENMCPPTHFQRMEGEATIRISGSTADSSAGSEHGRQEHHHIEPEMKTSIRNKYKRSSWFDFEVSVTKLVPLEDEQGVYNGFNRSVRNDSTTKAEHDATCKRRLNRRQSDFALQKRRVLENKALSEKISEVSTNRSLTKRFLSTVGLGKNSPVASTVSNEEELDVPFPTNARRRSCY